LKEALAGAPPEPLLARRRLRKSETIVAAYKTQSSAVSQLLFETDDGLLLQLCDRGLGWTMHGRRDAEWKAAKEIGEHLPTTLNPRPMCEAPWMFNLQLRGKALLVVHPGSRPGSVVWTVRSRRAAATQKERK
jgi:hypothetical protein